MAARNYFKTRQDLSAPIVRLITLSDTVELEDYPYGLRIYNSNATPATIRVDTVDGDTITLNIPGSDVQIIYLQVAKIYVTGTSTGLTIHGFLTEEEDFRKDKKPGEPPVEEPEEADPALDYSEGDNSQYLLTLLF